METLKKFTDNKERVEAEFIGFMEQSIWNCARNVTRKVSAEELRNSGISLEALYKGEYINYIPVEDRHDFEDKYEIMNLQVLIKSDLLKVLFDRLTQREKQVLILRVGFDYDYEEIGEILGITPKRAKDYKYQGLRKVRKYKNGRNKQN